MLIDDFLPAYDVVERHEIRVRAPAATVYAALRHADLAGSPIVRLLFALRLLPILLVAPVRTLRQSRFRRRKAITLSDFEARGFRVLAQDPPHELLIGLSGAFWTVTGGLRPVNSESFRGPQPAGTARAAWNFRVIDEDAANCRLTTETRVQCADARSRRRFRCYWLMVRPFSGLVRRLMLDSIRRHAEA
jgi:hypothetical protein